jgi:glycosyltransferase involved in cell wall biosynthesis
MSDPHVSAVIPTRHRPGSLMLAIKSVLAQTYPVAQIVVVVDGPDPATTSMLAAMNESRVHVIALPVPSGGSEARNAGVAAACGEWIAFLDDDDEWLPEKIDRQLARARVAEGEPIVSCRFFACTEAGDRICPERLPRPEEPLCEYLLSRRGFRHSDGFIATPTILTRRSLLLHVPFRSRLKKHQDWDWVLRATREGARVFICPDVLAKCDMRSCASTSRTPDWRSSWDWIQENAHLVTPRAYAAFVTTHVGWQAAALGHWRAFLPLLRDARENGVLSMRDLLRFLGFWVVPAAARRQLHRWAS